MSDLLFAEYPKQDKPESVAKIFVQAWNRRDAAKIASLFDADAEFINVTGLWWHKREDIEKAHAYGLGTIFNQSHLQLLRSRVKYLNPKIAVVQAKMKLSGQSSVGEHMQPGERRNIFTFVVHEKEGSWSCASAQNTDIVPGMETFVKDKEGNLQAVDYRRGKKEKENKGG